MHEVRKSFKRVRAALRLVRDELGEDAYGAENMCFRDAARPLTAVRDAQILVETLDNLTRGRPVGAVRHALLENERTVSRSAPPYGRAFAAIRKVIARARGRVSGWNFEPDGWQGIEGGVRRVYRRGRLALAAADAEPTVEHLHELRKQAKYLWHILQLLHAGWIAQDQELLERAHELSQVLGDDHDLAVLRQTLGAEPSAFGPVFTLEELLSLIDVRREELRRGSFVLGDTLYADRPQTFTDRLGGYWNAAALSSALVRR